MAHPALLDEPFALTGDSLATLRTEKNVTLVDRDDTTTRDPDFAGVYVLSCRHPMPADELRARTCTR